MDRPTVEITEEVIQVAKALVPATRVHRTRVSPVDTLGGILGEFAFAQWLTGNWRNNEVGENKGKADLIGLIEIKTSIYPFKDSLNLVIREDYGAKFKDVYVQNIINVRDSYRKDIEVGTPVIIYGFTTHALATNKPAQHMTMRGGVKTPYRAFTTPIKDLRPMAEFRDFLADLAAAKGLSARF